MDAGAQPLQTVLVSQDQTPAMDTLTLAGPTSTLDPYTDQALLNPWPLYRGLREMGRRSGSKNTGCLRLLAMTLL